MPPFMSSRAQRSFGDMFQPSTDYGQDYGAPQQSGEDLFPSYSVQNQFKSMFQPSRSLEDWHLDEPDDDAGRYYADVKKAYSNTPALDAYRAHIAGAPSSADYQPKWWERLGAVLSGAAAGFKDPGKGVAVARNIIESRYRSALDDYLSKTDPLKEAASIERQQTDNYVDSIMKANELGLKYDEFQQKKTNDLFNQGAKTEEIGIARGGLQNQQQRTLNDYTVNTKRLANDERNTNSMVKYRQGQTGQGWADVRTRQQNAQTGSLNQQGMQDYRNWQMLHGNEANTIAQSRVNAMNQPTPGGISTAEQDVMSEIDKRYPEEFITYDATQGAYVLGDPPEVGTADYQTYLQMQRDIQAKANERATKGQVNFGLPPAGKSRYTELPPR